MIYLLSPRSGGPYKQLQLVAKKLSDAGYPAEHKYSFVDWIKLHFNSQDTIVSVIPFLFVRNRKNFILNIRGNYRKEKRFTNPLSYLYERNIRLANTIVVPSRYLKEELNLQQAKTIPTSTDIHTQSVQTSNNTQAKIRLATITNFDFRPKAQGISKLINIVNQLTTGKEIEINIYGGGKWLAHAKEQYELHNYKKFPVVFHGPFQNAADVLLGNDIFIYWSTFDNMPNVLIEATACGLPIVVNRYAAYAEVIGEDNLLCDTETQFTESLLQIIESPTLRQKYARENLGRSRLFDIDDNINKWIDVVKHKPTAKQYS